MSPSRPSAALEASPSSAPHPSAVDDEQVTAHVVARPRGEVDGGSGDVFGVAPTAGRDTLENLTIARFVFAKRFGVGGADVAGRDGVDVDAFGAPLVGESF